MHYNKDKSGTEELSMAAEEAHAAGEEAINVAQKAARGKKIGRGSGLVSGAVDGDVKMANPKTHSVFGGPKSYGLSAGISLGWCGFAPHYFPEMRAIEINLGLVSVFLSAANANNGYRALYALTEFGLTVGAVYRARFEATSLGASILAKLVLSSVSDDRGVFLGKMALGLPPAVEAMALSDSILAGPNALEKLENVKELNLSFFANEGVALYPGVVDVEARTASARKAVGEAMDIAYYMGYEQAKAPRPMEASFNPGASKKEDLSVPTIARRRRGRPRKNAAVAADQSKASKARARGSKVARELSGN